MLAVEYLSYLVCYRIAVFLIANCQETLQDTMIHVLHMPKDKRGNITDKVCALLGDSNDIFNRHFLLFLEDTWELHHSY